LHELTDKGVNHYRFIVYTIYFIQEFTSLIKNDTTAIIQGQN